MTGQSTGAPWLNHQKSLAAVNASAARRGAPSRGRVDGLRPGSGRCDWSQKRTSPVSRWNQPLPTMPWPDGARPVSAVAWAVQVTAGSTPASARVEPAAGERAKPGRVREEPRREARRRRARAGGEGHAAWSVTRSRRMPGGGRAEARRPRPGADLARGPRAERGRRRRAQRPPATSGSARRARPGATARSCAGGGHAVEDLGSTNGTTLDGAPFPDGRPWQDGDVVDVGGCRIVYRSRPDVRSVAVDRRRGRPCRRAAREDGPRPRPDRGAVPCRAWRGRRPRPGGRSRGALARPDSHVTTASTLITPGRTCWSA